MGLLLLGLALFLGMHSVRIFADGVRGQAIARLGDNGWRGLYSLVSLTGFVLIIYGYGAARQEAGVLWEPPYFAPGVASLLMLVAFILFVASGAPQPSRIKRLVRHPMVVGTLLWAVAHLLANGTTADALLFGAFAVWALIDFPSAEKRRQAALAEKPAEAVSGWAGDAVAVVAGTALWLGFMFFAHEWLFGVSPIG